MSKIILKKSSVIAKVPAAGDLDYGELALNYIDGKLYYKKADGTTVDYFKSTSTTQTPNTFTVSASVPSSPVNGDTWLYTATGIKYTYVNDGDSSQWVALETQLASFVAQTGTSGGSTTTVVSDSFSPFLLMGA